MRYPGAKLDLGDVVLTVDARVRGLPSRDIRWHVGVPQDTTPADRIATTPAVPHTGKADVLMDLQADKKVSLRVEGVDEVDNPAQVTNGVTYSTDNPDVIALTDNGDGTAVAAATGRLGTANVHVEYTDDNGRVITGDLGIAVVPGDAERITIVAGEPEEVTPDEQPGA